MQIQSWPPDTNFDIITTVDTFKDFKRITTKNVTLLGVPILESPH